MFPLSCHRSNEVLLDFRALTKSTVYTTKVHFQDNSNIFPAVYLVLLAESNIELIHGNNLERPHSGQRWLIKNIYLFFFLLLLLLSRIKKLIFLDSETSLTRSSIGKKEFFIFSLTWRQFPLLKQFKLLSWKRKAVSCLFFISRVFLHDILSFCYFHVHSYGYFVWTLREEIIIANNIWLSMHF